MGRKKEFELAERDQIVLGLNLFIVFAEILGLYLRLYILGSPGIEYYTVISNFLAPKNQSDFHISSTRGRYFYVVYAKI